MIKAPSNMAELNSLIGDHCNNEACSILQERFADAGYVLANKYDLDVEDVMKQICLHIPSMGSNVPVSLYDEDAEVELLDIIDSRLIKMAFANDGYSNKAGVAGLGVGSWKLLAKEGTFIDQEGNSIEYEVGEVDKNKGLYIESNLHYMQSPCHNSIYRYGIFVKGYVWPLAYISISPVDRIYKVIALTKAVGVNIGHRSCLNISRIYGFGTLPHNTISFLISKIGDMMSKMGFNYFITAVNPFLGFNGNSTLSSGFKAYALSPVAYGYDSKGVYATRRNGAQQYGTLETPPNILFVRGLNRVARNLVDGIENLYKIPYDQHGMATDISYESDNLNPLEALIAALRLELEHMWDPMTRYNRLDYHPNDPVSKGQCGVTSALVAKILIHKGYKALFCEGDVVFPDPIAPIRNHCWVRVPSFSFNGIDVGDIIIDITADQTGFHESVIFESDKSLRSRGIFYNQRRGVEPMTLRSDSLQYRLDILKSRINDMIISVD